MSNYLEAAMQENYLDILMNDHALIEKALLIIERQLELGEKMNISMFATLIDFLWDYGERCHNAKEEKVYFPLLLERGLPPMGPIGIMLAEHDQERNFIDLIKGFVAEKQSQGKLPDVFASAVRDYIELTKSHIWKENDILYPMGKQVIVPQDENYLAEQFKEIEKKTVGAGAYTRFLTLLNTLENQTGGKVNLLASLPYDVITNMLDSLPVELSFVDTDNRVRYFSKLDEKKIFARTLSVVGRTVQQCHPPKSIHLVNKIISEMKEGSRDAATFWIEMDGMFLHISYYAVRDEHGEYQGCVEMVQDVKPYRELEGEKRLLDDN